ncbi:transporter substrate-binding domain-containing protein [Vibrio sp. S9_S30]|uniref:substrate-binding periplasmic protein n=1 Tax=Vibrio sp. S9_S30 TaxID=2720226 RepID=UPI0016810AC8|nr:transporter substrate-binding domain-containing protein [Vibrio sp. S9_S30]MBD1556742.1 transporter substrate-binding domain-containing protein [Vibrio sp. S9_S30]
MVYKTLFLFLVTVIASMSNIRILSAQQIIGVQDRWAPFSMSGKDKGIAVDIVTEAFKSQGYDLKFKLMPFSRAIHEVKKNRVDVLIATWYIEERATYLEYSDPYFYSKVKFIKLKGDPFEYFGMESLRGRNVGIVRSYGYDDDFSSSLLFQRDPVADTLSNLKKLIARRIDLTIEEPIVASYLMTENGLNPDLFEVSENSLSVNALHITTSKHHPYANQLIHDFNAGLRKIKKNGTYWSILVKYGLQPE